MQCSDLWEKKLSFCLFRFRYMTDFSFEMQLFSNFARLDKSKIVVIKRVASRRRKVAVCGSGYHF